MADMMLDNGSFWGTLEKTCRDCKPSRPIIAPIEKSKKGMW